MKRLSMSSVRNLLIFTRYFLKEKKSKKLNSNLNNTPTMFTSLSDNNKLEIEMKNDDQIDDFEENIEINENIEFEYEIIKKMPMFIYEFLKIKQNQTQKMKPEDNNQKKYIIE